MSILRGRSSSDRWEHFRIHVSLQLSAVDAFARYSYPSVTRAEVARGSNECAVAVRWRVGVDRTWRR